MSDANEATRQATHARQEGVDDNVAMTSGPVVADPQSAESQPIDSQPADSPAAQAESGSTATATAADTVAPANKGTTWSSAINAAPAPTGKKPFDLSGRWVAAAGMGIGSAALVAALLYANRGTKPPRGDR